MMKKRCLLALCLLLCAVWCVTAASADAQLRGYDKKDKYQYVSFGVYPQEADGTVQPVLWRVLEVKDGQALMLAEYVLDACPVLDVTDEKVIKNRTYRRISSIEESDMYPWMNTVMATRMFSPAELAALDDSRGVVFNLTAEEYCKPAFGFTRAVYGAQKVRQCNCTEYAMSVGVYREGKAATYWVNKVRSANGYMLQIVGVDGHMSYGAYPRRNIGVRPAVLVKLADVSVASGAGTMADPLVLTATAAVPTAAPTATPAPTVAPTAEPAAAAEATVTVPASAEGLEVVTAVVTPVEAPADAPVEMALPENTTVPEENDGRIVVSLLGDCSIGDSFQYRTYGSSYHKTLEEKGYEWPFSLVKDVLAADDLTVANLEVVLTTQRNHTDKLYNLIGKPEHVQALTAGSVEVVNTANNHAMDFNWAGYKETVRVLDEAGVKNFGSMYPARKDGVDKLLVVDVEGIRIGFVGFSYPTDYDIPRIKSRIASLKEEQGADYVIVSLHWGRETHPTPQNAQVGTAKQYIDSGADVIYGHHPHVLQPVQFYKGKPILYSTGNFTFGTMSRVDPDTGIFQLHLSRNSEGKVTLDRFSVVPCRTQSGPDFRPMLLTEEKDRRTMLRKLVWNRNFKDVTPLPDSFIDTGYVDIVDGQLVTE